MAGPVRNWLYARLAGDRMRLHPVPVQIAFVGGLAVFGVSGMVLGPAVLAVTMGLVDVLGHQFGRGISRSWPLRRTWARSASDSRTSLES